MRSLFAMAALFACAACSSRLTLTRDMAKDVIEKSAIFERGAESLTLDEKDVQAGLKAGFWKEQKTPELWKLTIGASDTYLELTPLGRKYFKQFHPQIEGRIVDFIHPARLTVTEVTGITNAPLDTDGTARVVDYVAGLKFDGDLQPLATVLTRNGTKAQALLKLFDDGWRVQAH